MKILEDGFERIRPEMIANLCDVLERRFSKMSSRVEASLADRVKDGVGRHFVDVFGAGVY